MTIDRSLRFKGALERHRNVLSREERIEKLKEDEEWAEDEDSVFGLPKVAHRKARVAKKEKEEEAEVGVEGEAGLLGEAAEGAEGAKPAAGAAEKKPAAEKPGEKDTKAEKK